MLPVLIFVVVAIPLLVGAFVVMKRSRAAGEHRPAETEADRERTEQEFEAAERYQAEWREEHQQTRDPLP